MSAYTIFILATGVVSLIGTIWFVTWEGSYRLEVALDDWLQARLGETGYLVVVVAFGVFLFSVVGWVLFTDISRTLALYF